LKAWGVLNKSLIRLILDSPEMLDSSIQPTRQDFEASINVKEILVHILENQELTFARDSFQTYFPIGDFIKNIDKSIDNLDEFEEDDDDFDEQDYEELRESHEKAIIDIYINLHFNKNNENLNIDLITDFFIRDLGRYYQEKLEKFLNEVDLDDTNSYRLSDLKFLIIHMQRLLK
jgi:hypothetical protein